MPGIPLVTRETSYSISTEMCHIDSRVHLSSEEEVAAEESLSIYCKPVELYNILQRRAIRNPLFLQKCLRYKVEAKHKKRIKLTVSLPGNVNEGPQAQHLFPMYIFLARLVSDISVAEYAAVYHFSRAYIMTNDNKDGSPVQASFVLPEINKLPLDAKSGTLAILLVSCVGGTHTSPEIELTEGSFDVNSFPSAGKYCLHGRIPLEPLYVSWANFPNFSLGQRAEMMSTLDMRYCFSKLICSNEEKCISFQVPCSSETTCPPQQVQLTICAEEFGAREKSPYNLCTCSDSPSSLSHIFRLRAGNVIFNYRYYNNKLQKTEVTEDFTCPFCLVKCASFKGLRCHLVASHDLFIFEFWVTEEYQAVNVSVKPDMWQSECIKYDVDPKKHTFFFCSRPLRCRSKHVVQNIKHPHLSFLESQLLYKAEDALSSNGEKGRIGGGNDFPNASIGASYCVELVTPRFNLAVASSTNLQSYTDLDYIRSLSANYTGPPTLLQFSKTRKLSLDRSDPRNCTLLWKRQFFHSHRTQPMALEQILSDRDSEDEVDDDVADFEDRRMLDDFVDVTKDEKKMMHMWNSFVRKQRVLADGHIPWACEAFSQLHGPELVKNPSLIWCWRLFVIKLWNHGLLDARAMNNCNLILDQFQNQPPNPTTETG